MQQSPEEKHFAWSRTTSEIQTLRLLVWLKVFQRLGYFPLEDDVPARIFEYIAMSTGLEPDSNALSSYNASSVKWTHHSLVRGYLAISGFSDKARKVATAACFEAAATRDDLVDIINVALEELVRQKFELPAFSTLMRIARTARSTTNSKYHQQVYNRLTVKAKSGLKALFNSPGKSQKTAWDTLKKEPKKPTVSQLKDFMEHLRGLLEHDMRAEAFQGIADVKVQQFAAEAKSLDVASMRDFAEVKRLALAAALVLVQVGRAFDDVAEMYIRLVQRMHTHAKEALKQYILAKAAESDELIAMLHKVSLAYKTDGDDTAADYLQ